MRQVPVCVLASLQVRETLPITSVCSFCSCWRRVLRTQRTGTTEGVREETTLRGSALSSRTAATNLESQGTVPCGRMWGHSAFQGQCYRVSWGLSSSE